MKNSPKDHHQMAQDNPPIILAITSTLLGLIASFISFWGLLWLMGSLLALGNICALLVKDYRKAKFKPQAAIKLFLGQTVLILSSIFLTFYLSWLGPRPKKISIHFLVGMMLVAVGMSLWLRLRSLEREKLMSGRITAKSSLPAWRKHIGKVVMTVGVLYGLKYPYTLPNFLGFQPPGMIKAVERGDIDTVRKYLEKGVDPNATNIVHAWRTPLHNAVRSGQKDLVELLLAKGADVNITDDWGETPLNYAIYSGEKDLVELVIAKSTDIDSILLEDLVEQDWKDLVEQQLAKYTDREAKENRIKGLLYYPVSKEMAQMLITKGADVNLKDYRGETPLHRLLGRRDSNKKVKEKEVVELLIANGADVNAKSNNGETPLHKVYYNKEVMELLIAKGADVNAKSNDGKTPLHTVVGAAHYCGTEVVELLLANGADVHAKDNNGETPLDVPLKFSHKDTAGLLITKGKNVNLKGKYSQSWSLLYWAILEDQKNRVELLIAKGAEVNAKGLQGRTPLYWAKSKEMAQLLIANGAEVNVTDNQGLSPLDWAAANGRRDVVELLKSHGAD